MQILPHYDQNSSGNSYSILSSLSVQRLNIPRDGTGFCTSVYTFYYYHPLIVSRFRFWQENNAHQWIMSNSIWSAYDWSRLWSWRSFCLHINSLLWNHVLAKSKRTKSNITMIKVIQPDYFFRQYKFVVWYSFIQSFSNFLTDLFWYGSIILLLLSIIKVFPSFRRTYWTSL
jgi:hypothetical protein